MAESVKIEGPIKPEAVRVLRSVPGLEVQPKASHKKVEPAMVMLRGGATEQPLIVEFKRSANAATAHQLIAYAQEIPAAVKLLVVADQTTKEARRLLAEHGIGIIDGNGQAHVELPGVLIHVERALDDERKQSAQSFRPARLVGRAGIVAQALLLEPKRAWNVSDLANVAHCSPALAFRVLDRLEREKVVSAEGSGPHRRRVLANATALLDLWVEEATREGVERVRAYRLSREPRARATEVGHAFAAKHIDHSFTGAAAALWLAPFVTSVPVVEVWISRRTDAKTAATAAQAELVQTGHNLLLLQDRDDGALAFSDERDGIHLVNPFRLYKDLLRDPRRGREQAQRIRQEVIGF